METNAVAAIYERLVRRQAEALERWLELHVTGDGKVRHVPTRTVREITELVLETQRILR